MVNEEIEFTLESPKMEEYIPNTPIPDDKLITKKIDKAEVEDE